MKRSTPDYKKLKFIQNPDRPGIYDLQSTNFDKFTYLRLESPKAPYLLKRGVRYVIESWSKSAKTLHTGLIPTQFKNIYTGNHKDQRGNKKSLLVVWIDPDLQSITILYFHHYTVYPGHINRFVRQLIEKKKGTKTRPPIRSTADNNNRPFTTKIVKL